MSKINRQTVLDEISFVVNNANELNCDIEVAEAPLWTKIETICSMYNLSEYEIADMIAAVVASNNLTILDAQLLQHIDEACERKAREEKANVQMIKKSNSICNRPLSKSHNFLTMYGLDDTKLDDNTDQGPIDALELDDDFDSNKENVAPNLKTDTIATNEHIMQFAPIDIPENHTCSTRFRLRSSRHDVIQMFRGEHFIGEGRAICPKITFPELAKSFISQKQESYWISSKPSDAADFFSMLIDEQASRVCTALNDEDAVRLITCLTDSDNPEPHIVCGRIICENDSCESSMLNTKESSSALWLESSSQEHCERVKFNVDKLKNCGIFAGMIACFKGTNFFGNEFQAFERVPPQPLPMAIINKEQFAAVQMSLIVASGPYTTKDSLLFEPLLALVDRAVELGVQLLIMSGPILSDAHPLVNTINESYENLIGRLITNIQTKIEGSEMKVFIVASSLDLIGCQIYPTCKYSSEYLNDQTQIQILPDPCAFELNGLLINVTTVDYLRHIAAIEDFRSSPTLPVTDRVARLLQYQFDQGTAYPMQPAHTSLAVDYSAMINYGLITQRPHLSLVPSDLRYFAKNVDEVLMVNPSRLTKENDGGTYAYIEIDGSALWEKRAATLAQVTNVSICRI